MFQDTWTHVNKRIDTTEITGSDVAQTHKLKQDIQEGRVLKHYGHVVCLC